MALYNINLTRTPDQGGVVQVNGTPVTTSIAVEQGTTVNLNAIAESAFIFSYYRISWDSEPFPTLIDTPNINYSFTMPAKTVTLGANFEAAAPEPPVRDTNNDLFDTTCPTFFFIKNLTTRYYTGDVADFTGQDYFEADEPIGFDEGMFKLERGEESHGFMYDFSVDELKYEFGNEAFDYIKGEFYATGTDSDIKFVYGYGTFDNLTILYIGKVDFNDYAETTTESDLMVSFGVRELDFDNLLQTAFDVDQTATQNLSTLLYSKVIPKKVTYTIPKPNHTDGGDFDELHPKAFYSQGFDSIINTSTPAQPPFNMFVNDGRTGDDIDIFATYDFQVEQADPYTGGSGFKYLLRAKQSGQYQIDVTTTFKLVLNQASSFATDDPTYSFMKLVAAKTSSDGQTIIGGEDIRDRTEILNNPTTDNFILIRFEQSYTFELQVEQCIYLFFRISPEDLPSFNTSGGAAISFIYSLPYQGNVDQPAITVVAQTIEKSSKTKTIKPYELLDIIISKAAGKGGGVVKSDFFNIGCGQKLAITNGFGIRGEAINDRTKIKISPKKLIESLTNLFCLGWGVEYGASKQELVRVEPTEYFYQDVEILSLDSISDYQKEIDTSKYYNEVEVGFSTYSKEKETDKGNTLDDFHTKHTYQTPIKTNKNKLSIVTDLILSAYEIEILRRKQFVEDGSNNNANFSEDERLFGVQLTDYVSFSGGEYVGAFSDLSSGDIISTSNSSLTVVGYAYFYIGQVIDVTVGANPVQRTSVLNIQFGYFPVVGLPFPVLGTYIKFSSAIGSSLSYTIDTVNSEAYLVPESNQGITITNLLSPQTAYNVRYTPKRMLYNWAKLINGGFIAKSATDEIVFKRGDGNVALTTQFNVGETCLLGDIDRDVIVENADVMIGDFNRGNSLFLPIKISISTNLSFEQLIDIKRCLRGQDDTRNYGYISILNPCNQIEKLYITSIEYSGVSDEAKIEGYLKEL